MEDNLRASINKKNGILDYWLSLGDLKSSGTPKITEKAIDASIQCYTHSTRNRKPIHNKG